MPGGPVLAVLGLAFCVLLASRMGRAELVAVVAVAGLALLSWLAARSRGST